MEKLGVEISKEKVASVFDKVKKEKVERCPKCSTALNLESNPPSCPYCGTLPLE